MQNKLTIQFPYVTCMAGVRGGRDKNIPIVNKGVKKLGAN